MAKRSDSVDLFERDLRAFLPFVRLSPSAFCRAHNFNRNMLGILKNGGSVKPATMDKAYDIMDENGFVSLRGCRDAVILAALIGDDEAMFGAAAHLRVYNKMYPDAGAL